MSSSSSGPKALPDGDIIRLADLNLDGRADFVTVETSTCGDAGNPCTTNLHIAMGNASGSFDELPAISFTNGKMDHGGCGLRLADFTGDGLPDIIYAADRFGDVFIAGFVNETANGQVKFR